MGKWQISMDPVQEWGEEVEDGVVYGVTLQRICDSVDPTDHISSETQTQGCVQYRTLKVRRLKAATLQRLVTELVKPECSDPDYPRIFLSTYRAFTCTTSLIQLLFQREDTISNLDGNVCVRSALPALVRLWLEEYWEDFKDAPQHSSLRLLCAHLRHRLCFRRLARQAETLLHTLQEEDRHAGSVGPEVTDAHAVNKSSREWTGPDRTETESLLNFSTRDIAEQLTRLDADLYVRVVPFHCLGCVWSQRDKKENRSLAPTVRATIAQFNAVTNWVITSLLCLNSTSTPGSPHTPRSPKSPCSSTPPSSPRPSRSPRLPRMCQSAQCPITSPAQRARIIEKWISIAQECHQLRNFSSLRAILSALQSNSVYRLKKTWTAVSRDSVAVFEQLCENFPDENCVLTNREILEEDSNHTSDCDSSTTPKSPKLSPKHTSCSSGEVPYLGTYLTVLTMLDTALPDTLEGGLINFEKRRREFEILSQIRVLQASCSLYSFPTHPAICSWLRSCTPLSDQQSYDLSRELEPPVDPCPNSPSFWSQRLITKKITSLLNSSERANADQISLSSSSSSGSDMDDLPTLRHKPQTVSVNNISEDPTSCSPKQGNCANGTSSLSSSSSSSSCCSVPAHPAYSKHVGDSCIIRVSMELDLGNVYKSILITSQDKTGQVVQRALSKHHQDNLSSNNFSLVQMLPHNRELLLPDKANVFYAMCPSESYDFVLRQCWKSHDKVPVSCSSPAAVPRGHHAK